MNGLRNGMRSPEYLKLLNALCDSEPGAVLRAGERCLTAAQRTHPKYMELVEIFQEVEGQMMEDEMMGDSYPCGEAPSGRAGGWPVWPAQATKNESTTTEA